MCYIFTLNLPTNNATQSLADDTSQAVKALFIIWINVTCVTQFKI